MANNILNRYSVNPVALDMPRSEFKANHSHKWSANLGECIPLAWWDILPGDTWSVNSSKVVRTQPLVTPIMDNLWLDVYYFYVPYRLVFAHLVNFFGENTESAWTTQTQYYLPQIKVPSGGFAVGTIADHLGVPPTQGSGREINALPFRVYAAIMDAWFRDENLMNPVHVTTGDTTITGSNGSDQVTDIEKGGTPFIACKFQDVFTSALPAPQKSANPVTFDLAGNAPVYADAQLVPDMLGKSIQNRPAMKMAYIDTGGTDTWHDLANYSTSSKSTFTNPSGQIGLSTTAPTGTTANALSPLNLWTDLSSVSQFNINELRMAFALQRFYERAARGGSRYIEFVQNFFGTSSSDYRYMRPEYIGGSRTPINISSVENVTNTSNNITAIGSVAGMSVTGDSSSDFTKSFTEHGMIMCIGVLRHKPSYQNGINKFFLKKEMIDMYTPVFANIGEVGITKDELYFNGTESTGKQIFGYQEAWYEYRTPQMDSVSGEMRSAATAPLDMWHLADDYQSTPSLSAGWIREDKSVLDRCLAVTSSQANQYYGDIYFECNVARVMPMYSIPGLIDHH